MGVVPLTLPADTNNRQSSLTKIGTGLPTTFTTIITPTSFTIVPLNQISGQCHLPVVTPAEVMSNQRLSVSVPVRLFEPMDSNWLKSQQ